MQLSLNIPINKTSLGQVSIALLKEAFKMKLEPNIFPIGEIDIGSHSKDDVFNDWLTFCVRKAYFHHKNDTPIFKNWHINGALERLANNQFLLTYLETDKVTDLERNILNSQNKVFVPNSYLKNVLENHGINNVISCPLGFDNYSFYKNNKKYYNDNRIVWGISGKWEKRKGHDRAIRAWIKKYKNNPNHILHLSIYNNFLNKEQNHQVLMNIFQGEKPWNVNVIPSMASNYEYNDYLNSLDIIIDASHNETFSLPSFQAICLGKWGVLHHAAGIKEWANNDNSILFKSNGKMIDVYDNIFFREDGKFSQGQYFDWDENDLISAMEMAEAKAKTPNPNGENLKNIFSYSKTIDTILNNLK
jgi:glycosyltransferase involved in cell wall biosynthesis